MRISHDQARYVGAEAQLYHDSAEGAPRAGYLESDGHNSLQTGDMFLAPDTPRGHCTRLIELDAPVKTGREKRMKESNGKGLVLFDT